MGTQLPRYPADGQATDLGLLYWLPQSLSALAWRLAGLENPRPPAAARAVLEHAGTGDRLAASLGVE